MNIKASKTPFFVAATASLIMLSTLISGQTDAAPIGAHITHTSQIIALR